MQLILDFSLKLMSSNEKGVDLSAPFSLGNIVGNIYILIMIHILFF